jgi:hypothetical protein
MRRYAFTHRQRNIEPIRVLPYTSGATRQLLPSRAIKASGDCLVITSSVTSEARDGSFVGRVSAVRAITGPLSQQADAGTNNSKEARRSIG